MNNEQKTVALFGGKLLTVNFEPLAAAAAEGGASVPASQELKVRQIPIRDYARGFTLVEVEPALVGFLGAGRDGVPPSHDKAWALTLAPDSYEEILAAGREVNARGFFAFCQRHTEALEKKQQATMLAGMTLLKDHPELLAQVMKSGAASPTTSPVWPPRPAA
jgi:hypothetical protein